MCDLIGATVQVPLIKDAIVAYGETEDPVKRIITINAHVMLRDGYARRGVLNIHCVTFRNRQVLVTRMYVCKSDRPLIRRKNDRFVIS